MSDALEVAKWCWPCCTWAECDDGTIRRLDELAPCKRDHLGGDWLFDQEDGFEEVHDAERVLVARGLSEQYGEALWEALGGDEAGDGPSGINGGATWADLTRVATAPLDARLRALAAVVRAQKTKETR